MILLRIKMFVVKAFDSRFYDKLMQKILVSLCIFYSILDIRLHIDASSYEESYSKRCIFQIFDQLLDRTSYKSILRHI